MKLRDFSMAGPTGGQADLLAMLQSFNNNRTEYPRDKTVHAVFVAQAEKTPDALAVFDGEGHGRTYREVNDDSDKLAHFLIDHGLQREQVVGVMLEKAFELTVAILGVLKAGGAYCPIDHDAPCQRARYLLEDTNARFLLSEKAFVRTLHTLQCDCPSLDCIVCLDRLDIRSAQDDPGAIKADEVSGMIGPQLFDDYPAERVAERTGPDGLAYIIYTSGTSGQPKGTLVEHRSILRLVMNTNYIQLGPQDRVLQTGSLAFDASTFEIWGPLLNGGSFCRPDQHAVLDSHEIQRLIRDRKITTMWLTTSLFNQYAEDNPGMFVDLTTLLTGGEKVSVRHMNAVRNACPDLVLMNAYGPTENTTFSTYFRMKERQMHDVPIGAPIANSTVYILDGSGQPVPVGVSGEICTGGDGVARGYLNRPDLTAEKFIPDPFAGTGRLYRTGDLGSWRVDGQVMFLGRIDNQVKVRGYRVEPGEIESQLKTLCPVGDVVVVARELDGGDVGGSGRELVCYFTAKVEIAAYELRDTLKGTLPDYMVPAYFMQLDRLPLNTNGKVDKTALPKPELTYQSASRSIAPPRDTTEKQLVEIWEEVLGHGGIGTTDDFFDVGGHSLKIVKMVSLIHNRMGIDVPLATIFKASTVREMAARIMDQARYGTGLADEAVVALRRNAGGRKLFAFPPGTGDVLSYIPLADLLYGYSLYACNFIESENRLSLYADIITEMDPHGPYVFMGYSAGGNLAYQVACELESRGRVVSDVIMLDAARVLGEIRFPDGEVEKVTDAFLSHESIRPYVQNTVLQDKMARKIRCYYAHIQKTVDTCITDANIHVLLSEVPAGGDISGMAEYPVSVDAWADITRGVFRTYKAVGQHNDMLYEPALARNAAMLKEILDGIVSRQEHL